MNEIETFMRADRVLADVVSRIPPALMAEALPADFPTQDDRTYRQMLNYQAYDEAWIPDMMAGRTIDEVGQYAHGGPLDDDLLGTDPRGRFEALVEESVASVRELEESELDTRSVHYTYGDYPLREALWHAIVFRTTRAFDFARAIGADTALPDDFIESAWAIVEPHAEEWRSMGVFGPAVEIDAEAPLQNRLMALTGRQP
ncbi:hypothetical protein GCM10009775_22250 [Microbacterium aoyamense]|uniref:Uncharacterized protein n=1 Tax=Microbacterium aoyamense TaxID=344166 RepID=A0ABN2PSC0_9MICO|nr:hypothetical protein [Microbacterium aoyamense]